MIDPIRKANANIPEKLNKESFRLFQPMTPSDPYIVSYSQTGETFYEEYDSFKEAYNCIHSQSVILNPGWHKEHCDHKDCTGKEQVVKVVEFETGTG